MVWIGKKLRKTVFALRMAAVKTLTQTSNPTDPRPPGACHSKPGRTAKVHPNLLLCTTLLPLPCYLEFVFLGVSSLFRPPTLPNLKKPSHVEALLFACFFLPVVPLLPQRRRHLPAPTLHGGGFGVAKRRLLDGTHLCRHQPHPGRPGGNLPRLPERRKHHPPESHSAQGASRSRHLSRLSHHSLPRRRARRCSLRRALAKPLLRQLPGSGRRHHGSAHHHGLRYAERLARRAFRAPFRPRIQGTAAPARHRAFSQRQLPGHPG